MVKYVNSNGLVLELDDRAQYFILQEDLKGYDWSFSTIQRVSGFGGMVDLFTRPVCTKTITLGIRGHTEEALLDAANRFHERAETDIWAQKPGRLYLNKQYITCYLAVKSKVDKAVNRANSFFIKKTVQILVVEPFWTTEHTVRFGIDTGEIGANGKRYNNRYPYRYGTSYALHSLTNRHYAKAPCVITIYGPCANPVITIDGNQHGAMLTLMPDERLVINQIEKTVTRTNERGEVYNQFDARTKVDDPFRPVPPGKLSVSYNGSYAFDITMHYQRGEPLWT